MTRILFSLLCAIAVALVATPLLAVVVSSDDCDPITHFGVCEMQTRDGAWTLLYVDLPQISADGGRTYNNRFDPGHDLVLDRFQGPADPYPRNCVECVYVNLPGGR